MAANNLILSKIFLFFTSQFEIVGCANHGTDNKYDLCKPTIKGKLIYKRLLIKRK